MLANCPDAILEDFFFVALLSSSLAHAKIRLEDRGRIGIGHHVRIKVDSTVRELAELSLLLELGSLLSVLYTVKSAQSCPPRVVGSARNGSRSSSAAVEADVRNRGRQPCLRLGVGMVRRFAVRWRLA